MDAYPHEYKVAAHAANEGDVILQAEGLDKIASAPPIQFDGPGDRWSPEDLLVASVADCFILTFRAIAKFSQLDWSALECSVVGTLDKVDRTTSFTAFGINARLIVPEGTDKHKAHQLLEKSEASCLVTNSLKATVTLNAEVIVE